MDTSDAAPLGRIDAETLGVVRRHLGKILGADRSPRAEDAIVEHAADTPGTRVRMRLANDSDRLMQSVDARFERPRGQQR